VSKSTFLDDLAELGARTATAPRALIFKRELSTQLVTVVGRYGTLFDSFGKYKIPEFLLADQKFFSIPDIRADERLAGHPILEYVPRIHSMIVADISPNLNYVPKYKFTMGIVNSGPEAFEAGSVLCAITHMVEVCRQFVSALGHVEAFLAESSVVPLPAYAPVFNGQSAEIIKAANDEAASYLIDTLTHKHALHENDVGGFISLRTWRKSMRVQQQEALAKTMQNPSEDFLEHVAAEFAVSAHKMFGKEGISTVVPLPKAATPRDVKLAALVAERVASKLGAKFVNALEFKSSKAQTKHHVNPFKVVQNVTGGVLLLDDLASSVQNIGAAQGLVRNSGATCFAMSWIGPT
jgi:hypothetical protein